MKKKNIFPKVIRIPAILVVIMILCIGIFISKEKIKTKNKRFT